MENFRMQTGASMEMKTPQYAGSGSTKKTNTVNNPVEPMDIEKLGDDEEISDKETDLRLDDDDGQQKTTGEAINTDEDVDVSDCGEGNDGPGKGRQVGEKKTQGPTNQKNVRLGNENMVSYLMKRAQLRPRQSR